MCPHVHPRLQLFTPPLAPVTQRPYLPRWPASLPLWCHLLKAPLGDPRPCGCLSPRAEGWEAVPPSSASVYKPHPRGTDPSPRAKQATTRSGPASISWEEEPVSQSAGHRPVSGTPLPASSRLALYLPPSRKPSQDFPGATTPTSKVSSPGHVPSSQRLGHWGVHFSASPHQTLLSWTKGGLALTVNAHFGASGHFISPSSVRQASPFPLYR